MNPNDNYILYSKVTRKTLKEASYDEKNDEYMTDSEKIVIDFDQAKTKYCNALNLSNECAKSADACCRTGEDKYYLIEFKNGRFDNHDVSEKAKESAVIFSGITGKSINDIRKSVTFILVYNKNSRCIQEKDRRALALANKGKCDFALFGLGMLRGLYYDKVYAMEKDAFNRSSYLRDILSL